MDVKVVKTLVITLNESERDIHESIMHAAIRDDMNLLSQSQKELAREWIGRTDDALRGDRRRRQDPC